MKFMVDFLIGIYSISLFCHFCRDKPFANDRQNQRAALLRSLTTLSHARSRFLKPKTIGRHSKNGGRL